MNEERNRTEHDEVGKVPWYDKFKEEHGHYPWEDENGNYIPLADMDVRGPMYIGPEAIIGLAGIIFLVLWLVGII